MHVEGIFCGGAVLDVEHQIHQNNRLTANSIASDLRICLAGPREKQKNPKSHHRALEARMNPAKRVNLEDAGELQRSLGTTIEEYTLTPGSD
jgi:hypothetical protein